MRFPHYVFPLIIAIKMKLPALVAAFSVFLVRHFQLSAGSLMEKNIAVNAAANQKISFYVHNKCTFPIWPATASNIGYPVIADGGFSLPAGQTQRIYTPLTWSGRIWARTGCKFNETPAACETGNCDGRLACKGLVGTPPATLVEISAQEGKLTFYDVSLVDGYNIPVSVTSKQLSPSCNIKGCSKSVNSLCPQELRVLNKNGVVVACKSACLAFNLDEYCCRNEYGSPGKCKANAYSKIFKDACSSYYSFAFDTPPPLVNCPSKEYVITFCPSSGAYASK